MGIRATYQAVKDALAPLEMEQVEAFCGDTVQQIKEACAESGDCLCVSFESADISSANASYRVSSSLITVYYACSIARASTGLHLDRMEAVFTALHALRIGNSTLKAEGVKLVNRDSVLVYALNFTL